MSGAMSAVFVTEASPEVGLGHLRRCEALATALRRRGATSRFLVDGEAALAGPEVVPLAWTRDPALACAAVADRKSTRLNSSHGYISYAVFRLKKKTRRTSAHPA